MAVIMTNEEAISRIKTIKLKIEPPTNSQLGWLETWIHKEDEEAFDMAIKALEQEPKEIYAKGYTDGQRALAEHIELCKEEQEPTGWIPVKTRPMTEEETEHYSEYTDMRIDDTYTILDCPLPDDGQEVLVSWGGNVMVDVFVRDNNDGCYFEGVDIDEVDAWMPLPEPYKESEG